MKLKKNSKNTVAANNEDIETPEIVADETPEIVSEEESSKETVKVDTEEIQLPDTIRISVFRTIDPSPVIGGFNWARELGHPKVVPGVYTVPYNAGIVLIDRGLASRS